MSPLVGPARSRPFTRWHAVLPSWLENLASKRLGVRYIKVHSLARKKSTVHHLVSGGDLAGPSGGDIKRLAKSYQNMQK